MTDASRLPFSHLSACSLAVGFLLLQTFFFYHAPYCIPSGTPSSDTHRCIPPHLPFPHHSETWSGKMSHLQPRWKCTLVVTSSSFVTVWTLMKKRWVLSCAPIYLSDQGTCTLIPASPSLPPSPWCHSRSVISRLSFFRQKYINLIWVWSIAPWPALLHHWTVIYY